MNANKPNSREKTDILKCEILNFIQSSTGLQAWVQMAALDQVNPAEISKLLDIRRREQIGILGKIFTRRKYSKYKWQVYIIAAISELQKEGYKNVGIGTTPVTSQHISQWSYQQSKSMLIALGVPEEKVNNYITRG